MEEKLIENKRPSKFGTVATALFIMSWSLWLIVLFLFSIKFTAVAEFMVLIELMSMVAVFPFSIIGIVKDLKNRVIKNSHSTVILAAHTISLIVVILNVILISKRAN